MNEAWLKGWPRRGDVVWAAQPHCAACGLLLGITCIALSGNEPTEAPDWPFNQEDCPLCAFRDEVYRLREGPQDKLTERMLLLQKKREKE